MISEAQILRLIALPLAGCAFLIAVYLTTGIGLR
ncbi:hypothetical protein J2W51_002842 [Tardiphaga robiniae]|jgi:hypothetical protein|nr:hypothetical protein [Tardiphaga robiniae]